MECVMWDMDVCVTVIFSHSLCVSQVQYVDLGLVENIPVCHVYPMVVCEDVPQLCVPLRLHKGKPVCVCIFTFTFISRWILCDIMDIMMDPSYRITIMCDSICFSQSVQVGRHWHLDAVALMKELVLGRRVNVQIMVTVNMNEYKRKTY